MGPCQPTHLLLPALVLIVERDVPPHILPVAHEDAGQEDGGAKSGIGGVAEMEMELVGENWCLSMMEKQAY